MYTDVQRMFDEIAPTYDLLNHVLSFGLDVWWRRKAVSHVLDKRGRRFLDIAAGTGDFSIAALRAHPHHIVGLDFAPNTLLIAREKFEKRITLLPHHTTFDLTRQTAVGLAAADALSLPFHDDSFIDLLHSARCIV